MIVDDRWLDEAPWRVVERAYRLQQETRKVVARRRRRRGRGHPTARAMAALGPASDDPAWVARALEVAVQGNGYQVASAHAAWLLARVDALAPALRRAALPMALDTLLATGDRARAREIAEAHRADLAPTSAGATLLGLLELASADHLPDGRLDAVSLSRRLDRGTLDADALRRLLVDHPRALLRDPQLHLLACTAERPRDRVAAAAALNRYLRAYRLPRCALAEPSPQVLHDVWFPGGAPAPRGPLVSILMAAHRARATITYAIDSLLAQTYRDVEILVCDDASDDGTAELVAERYRHVPRVRLFTSAINQGPYNLRNRLLAEARGVLVTFHDADDLALPTRIATQVERLASGRAVASLTTWVRVTPAGRFIFFRDQAAQRLAMVSLMAPRRIFDELGGFRAARFGADLDFYELLRERYPDRIDILRRPQLLGLWSSTSLTRQAGAESLEDGFRSPSRRAYADLLFARALHGLADAELERALRELGNWAEPGPISRR